MNIKLLSATLLLFTAFTSLAQNKDLVVTAAGDTIPCNITHSIFIGGSFKYRTPKDDKPVKITIDNTKAYYFGKYSSWTRKIYYEGKPSFMTLIENGKINLYEYVNTYTAAGAYGSVQSTVFWYASKGPDTLILIKADFFGRQSRKNELGNLFADNKLVYDKYTAEAKFSFKQIRNLVHLYNTGKPLEEITPPKKEDYPTDFNPSSN